MKVGIRPCLVVTMISLSIIRTPPLALGRPLLRRWPDGATATAYCAANPEGRMAKDEIDRLLRAAVSDGRVPGVVALAADRNGTFYQGAFGQRGLGRRMRR